MLVSEFGLMWVLLLYLLITVVLTFSLSLPFVFPVIRLLREAGVGELFQTLFDSIRSGEGTNVWFDNLYAIVHAIKNVLINNKKAAFNTGALIGLVLVFAYRFIFGLYEIPLTTVLEGSMSSNARIGFTGRYIAGIGRSCKFVLVKILYTVIFDAVICLIAYGLFELLNVPVFKFFAPFIIMLAVLSLLALRYSLIAMWAPDIVIRGSGIFRAFGYSVKKGIHNLGSVFSSFVVAWTLLIAVNMLVGFFTFGAGLVLTVPLSVLFMNLLNMTVYYGKNGKRYYVDGTTVVTPPQTEK